MLSLNDRRPPDADGTAADGGLVAGGQIEPPKANILIVDDKPQNLYTLRQMLDELGENVVEATSGAAALRHLLRQDFAIVLVDIQMPDMDGYELATLVRNRERSRHMPIIFMTAFNKEEQDISRGYALGAVDYVFKPIDPVILRAKVTVFVDLFKKTEAIRRTVALEHHLQMENIRVRSEKLEAERALRQIEERQSLIVRSLPIALYTADLDGRFAGPRFLSESIAGMVGFEATTFVEDTELWVARIHPSDLPRVLSQVDAIAETGSLTTEYRWRCADGSERVFLDQAVLVRDEAGKAQEILGTCMDVTDRRQLERQLLQSQKMQAIGQLTGGIAHDFNNMLSVIIWNLGAVTKSMKGGTKTYEQVQMAMKGALNCAELIRQLLTFARQQPDQAKVVDLLEVVPRVANLLRPVIGEQITVDVRLADELWPVLADPAQVESALLNLAINARDAMQSGGTLTVQASNFRYDNFDGELAVGDYVMIAVADTGCGMPPEVVDRAFEPFFTTKGTGEGSGLGLSMVYAFAKQSRGQVKIESTVGVGTTVRIYLPRTEAASMTERAARPEGSSITSATNRAILVVEDDADVRCMTVARLNELGHRVIEADSAASALDLLFNGAEVDVLFTDVVMPGGMNGIDLARRAIEVRPGLKVLFASGYASSFHSASGVAGELLQKPYRDEELQGALIRAFTRRPKQANQSAA